MPCPDDDVGRALITDPRVDAVILTGSAETARRFLAWRPNLTLFAETSGKNAMVITSLADRDQAIRDLVRSAFGHQGQKCSAASLAICEAEVYDDAVFRRQLRDAGGQPRRGQRVGHVEPDHAADPAPWRSAPARPHHAGRRRGVAPRAEGGRRAPAPLVSGIKLGVRRGSFFHHAECFGPVLGLMRAEHLDEAIDLANGTPYGLTSGIQSLDDREIDQWLDRVEAGNLYVNRPITGAMVGRQPFGGWKASSVGPGAKVGGPNYVLQLAHWRQVSASRGESPVSGQLSALLERFLEEADDEQAKALLRASAASYALAWQDHFSREHDPTRILGERNVFRYRPCRGMLVRAETVSAAGRLAFQQVLLAALTCGVPLTVSLSRGEPWSWLAEHSTIAAVTESEGGLIERLRSSDGVERLRVLDPVSLGVRAAAHEAGAAVIDALVLAVGRLELRWYLREQTVARVVHRYGNVIEAAVE